MNQEKLKISTQTEALPVLLVCPSTEVLASLGSHPLPNSYLLHLFQISGFNPHPLSITTEIDLCEVTQQAITEAQRVQAQAILFASDLCALISAVVCERLNLPGPSLASIVKAYCKPLARQLDPVESILVHVLDAAAPAIPSDINFPVFVKPICGSASQFSGSATTLSELKTRCVQVATHYSPIWQKLAQFFQTFCPDTVPQKWLSMQAPVLVEPFLPGNIINCDGYVQKGETKILGFVGESHTATEQHYFVPVPLSSAIEQQIVDYTTKLCRSLEIDQSCFCVEYMVQGETVQLMEFNPRIASCFRSLYRQCFEIDLFQAATQISLGQTVILASELPRKSPCYFVNLYLKNPQIISPSEQVLDFEMADHLNQLNPFEVIPSVQPKQPIYSLFAYANLWGETQSSVDHWASRLSTLVTRPFRTIKNRKYDISVFFKDVEAVEGIVNTPELIAWIDYQSCQLYEYKKVDDDLKITSLPFPAYSVAYHQNGQILFGGPMGLVVCDRTHLYSTNFQLEDCQILWKFPINTIRVDPVGRLYATEETSPTQNAGRLIKFDRDGSVQVIDKGLSYGNTIDFSPDGNRIYVVDTTRRCVIQYDLDDSGNPKNQSKFAVFAIDDGVPDGLVVDAEGNVWVTSWFGGKVKGYDPLGHWIGDLLIPVQNVTSVCTFRGHLLVTTASQVWPEGQPWMPEFFIPPPVSQSPIYSVCIQDWVIQDQSAYFAQILLK